MFITVTATTALVSVALNAAAIGTASYAGYRYLRARYEDMKAWIDEHDAANDEINRRPQQTMRKN
jgi:hypothetical protein